MSWVIGTMPRRRLSFTGDGSVGSDGTLSLPLLSVLHGSSKLKSCSDTERIRIRIFPKTVVSVKPLSGAALGPRFNGELHCRSATRAAF